MNARIPDGAASFLDFLCCVLLEAECMKLVAALFYSKVTFLVSSKQI